MLIKGTRNQADRSTEASDVEAIFLSLKILIKVLSLILLFVSSKMVSVGRKVLEGQTDSRIGCISTKLIVNRELLLEMANLS